MDGLTPPMQKKNEGGKTMKNNIMRLWTLVSFTIPLLDFACHKKKGFMDTRRLQHHGGRLVSVLGNGQVEGLVLMFWVHWLAGHHWSTLVTYFSWSRC